VHIRVLRAACADGVVTICVAVITTAVRNVEQIWVWYQPKTKSNAEFLLTMNLG